MGTFDTLWREWAVVGNSRGYGSAVFVQDDQAEGHCFVKVGDELRHARYHGGRWTDFVSVGGGRFSSDPVVVADIDNEIVEVYGAGLEGQLARNVWRTSSSSWQGWQDLGAPAGGILGRPAAEHYGPLQRFVVARGSDNRLYLCYSEDGGETWAPWEQDDRLRGGQFTGEASTFTIRSRDERARPPELIVAGRSMENEMASISRIIKTSSTRIASRPPWKEWGIVENSKGYSSPVFAQDPRLVAVHCFVKVGDELRHTRYSGVRWAGFVPVDGGRIKSDPVIIVDDENEVVEVYGAGLEGQLARNVWPARGSSWRGWEDLGRPDAGISGTPAVAEVELSTSMRFVVVRGDDNRLYLRYSDDGGEGWAPWEQGDRLKQGQLRGDVSTFISAERGVGLDLVVTGRNMENEMASISLPIFDF